jgi:uncharacterized protein YjbI with pentapeptide repeats
MKIRGAEKHMETTKDSVDYLESLIRGGMELFETTILIRHNGRIRHARINFSQGELHVTARKMGKATNLQEAYARITEDWMDGDLLVDALTVRTSTLEYLAKDHPVHVATKQLWTSSSPYRVVSAHVHEHNQEVSASFANLLSAHDECKLNVYVRCDGRLRELELTATLACNDENQKLLGAAARNIHLNLRDHPFAQSGVNHWVADGSDAMATIGYLLNGGNVLPETLVVTVGKAGESRALMNAPLYECGQRFLSACAKMEQAPRANSNEDVDQLRETEVMTSFISYLLGGAPGIAIWNGDISDRAKTRFEWHEHDFKGQDLSQARLTNLSFVGSDFSNATLKQLEADATNFSACTFKNADLTDSQLNSAKAVEAYFSNAKLVKCKFHDANLRGGVFKDANVAKAEFKGSDLRGVDLTSCNFLQAKSFAKALYDEGTVLPTEFPHWKNLVWAGAGPDPYLLSLVQAERDKQQAKLDFAGFMQFISTEYDQARVAKAVSMLKKSTFELFVEQNSLGMFGVVKSQSDEELIYACKLGTDGTFGCCTQNLNACGGLRSALCKHILVLVIGLVRAGELDPTDCAHRIVVSKQLKPSIDRDLMSDVFVRYSGVQHGEIDWRPTETVPEDYYSL